MKHVGTTLVLLAATASQIISAFPTEPHGGHMVRRDIYSPPSPIYARVSRRGKGGKNNNDEEDAAEDGGDQQDNGKINYLVTEDSQMLTCYDYV